MSAQFTVVKDQGGNIGLHCPICNQARWQEGHDTKDWSTNQDCPNCLLLKQEGRYLIEHEKELLKQKQAAEQAKIDADVKAAKDKQSADKVKSDAITTAATELKQEEGVGNG